MKFTIVSHACLLVESGTDRLLIDPWILGTCYWRSWWHFPPARADLFDPNAITAIYYTHEHSDHLHYPSLRRFPRQVRILVPRFPVNRMVPALHERGFTNVEEMPHCGSVAVGALQVFSYQYGFDDSAVIVTDGETTILNMNDAKLNGLALRHILKRFPRIDFALRSHAPAQAYPFCYTADDAADLELIPLSYYTESFAAVMRVVKPRWAIPFASNVCHLHPESRHQNAHMISPDQVVAACRDHMEGTEVVPMAPGDSWETGKGFALGPRYAPGDIEQEIERLTVLHAATIDRAIEEEAQIPPIGFEQFDAYMSQFARAVPWFLRRAFAARVAFELAGQGYFVVDLKRARVERVSAMPTDVHSIVQVNPHIVTDAMAKGGINLLGISKRIHVHLRPQGLYRDLMFWELLMMYELGYFPISKLLNARSCSVLAARWREMIGYVRALRQPNKSLEVMVQSTHPND